VGHVAIYFSAGQAHDVRTRCLAGIAGLLLALIGCGPTYVQTIPTGQSATVAGTVTYGEQLTLPADAVVEVWVDDADPDAQTLGVVGQTAFLTNGRQVPLAFAVHFNPSQVTPGRAYVARAVIRHNGQILFSSTNPTPVSAGDNPTNVEVRVAPVTNAP